MADRRYTLKFTTGGGVGITGLAPTIKWAKVSDFTSPGTEPTVAQANPSLAPGVYFFDYDPQEEIVVTVDSNAGQEVVLVIGPLDGAAERLLGLAKEHFNFYGTTYDAAGRLLQATVRIYRSKAEKALDVPAGSTSNFLFEYVRKSIYDATSGNMTLFDADTV